MRTNEIAFRLNFHHLLYFWAVAKEGNLTRAAKNLRVAQSAVSAQIRHLEEQVGQALFAREGRGLVLSEAGKIAYAYADDIVRAGGELVSTLQEGRMKQRPFRVGAVATLSRNFQRSFVRPILARADTRLDLTSGGLEDLLVKLERHELDVVLSNRPAAVHTGGSLRSRRLARQPASIVSSEAPSRKFRFPTDLRGRAMILPGASSNLRVDFDVLCDRLGLNIQVIAEVDDMATLRLLARDSDALALVPSIVVRDELREGLIHELCVVPELAETFYAITVERQYQHPLLSELLARTESMLLGSNAERARGRSKKTPLRSGRPKRRRR